MSKLLEVEGAHPVLSDLWDDLANRIASVVSAGVKDGVPVNGSRRNCHLSCLFDLSPVRRIGGGVN